MDCWVDCWVDGVDGEVTYADMVIGGRHFNSWLMQDWHSPVGVMNWPAGQ